MGHNLWGRAVGFLNGTEQAADVRSLLTDAGCPDAGPRVFLADLWTTHPASSYPFCLCSSKWKMELFLYFHIVYDNFYVYLLTR